ncbi:MAG: archease [Candidatus Zixiibacteriota bacterium]
MRAFQINDKYSSADIGIDVTADSLEELFIAAAEGLTAIAISSVAGNESRQTTVRLSADSREQLLVDWLSELIYLFDADGFVSQEFAVKIKAGEGPTVELSAEIRGRGFNPETDTARHDVKAVTYYKLAIKDDGGKMTCHVVFDL